MPESCEDIILKKSLLELSLSLLVIHFFETSMFFFVVVSLNVKRKINSDYNKQK